MPITVTFAEPVADRAAAERSFAISAPRAPQGNFVWLKNDVVQWNPSSYWPAHSDISVSMGRSI